MSPRIGAVILAAGGSTRLGFPKQLVTYEGEPLLTRTAKAALAIGANPAIVVLGANADSILPVLANLPVTIVVNPNWSTGLSSSLVIGVATAFRDSTCDGVLVTLADQPLVDAPALRKVVDAFDAEHRIIASEYDGVIGVPALFAREFLPDLLLLNGDAGARSLLRSRRQAVTCVPLGCAALDIDTASDLTVGAFASHQTRA